MSCIDGALIRNLHTVPVNAGDGLWRAYEEGAWTTTNKLWCFRFDEPENVALYGGTSCTGWYVETGSGETRPCIVGADGCTKGEITPLCSEPSPPYVYVDQSVVSCFAVASVVSCASFVSSAIGSDAQAGPPESTDDPTATVGSSRWAASANTTRSYWYTNGTSRDARSLTDADF